MKDRARPTPRRQRPEARRQNPRARAAGPARELSDRDSLLYHLEDQPEMLEEAWQRARTEEIPLPHKSLLEERFGEALDHVRVFAGPETASLLDALGAEGAARGDEILLESADASLEVTAHEIAHVLQGGGPAPEALWPGIVTQDAPVEQAAETAAREVAAGEAPEQPDAEQPMKPGWVALFRRGGDDGEIDVTADDAPASPPVVEVDDPAAEAEGEAGQRAARAPRRRIQPEGQPPPGQPPPRPRTGTQTGRAPADEEASAARAEPDEDEPPELAPGPDRRQELMEIRDTGQETWDSARARADRHETRDCPCARVRQGERPFQRGPPVDVPETREVPRDDTAEPEPQIPEEELNRAERRVRNQLARGPPEADRFSGGAEQAAAIREIDREIEREAAPEIPETPELSLTDDANPQQIDDRRENLKTTSETNKRSAIAASDEDFGEDVLAPGTDPTLGHDTTLDGLELPQVSLQDRLPDETLDRVATDANAGQLPLDQVLVAQDQDVEATRARATQATRQKAAAGRKLSETDDDLESFCERACAAREAELRNAGTGVGRTREGWRRAIDAKVAERRGEGETLARERKGHVNRIHRQANRDAGTRLRSARTEATSRWTEAKDRASNKSQEGRDPSLWERGVAWFRRQLNRLKQWIGDFLEACRSAIGALLEAARSAAHAIVEAGRTAVTDTIDATRATLDALADNLPGELGEIAQDFRDDAFEFLDRVQTRVDAAADDLNGQIDGAIDDLQDDLDGVFEDFEEGIDGAIDFIGDAVEDGPVITILRRSFPALADLVESGLDAVSNRAAETLDSWIESAFEAIGLDRLTQWLTELAASSPCEATPEEQEQRTCEAFNGLMDRAMGWVNTLLDSPAARSIQAELQERQDDIADQQMDEVSSFVGFIQFFAQPIYQAWLAIEDAAGRVMKVLGDVGRTVWRHIAAVLGLDINLDPLTAIRQGIERLWDTIVSAVQPLLDGLRTAWQFIRDYTPIGAFLDFIAALPALWQSLTEFAGRIAEGIENALTRAAQWFRETILPAIQGALSAISGLLHRLVDVWQTFAGFVLGAIEALLSIEFGLEILNALRRAVARLAAPFLTAIRIVHACAFRFWRVVADAVGSLLDWIRTFADICTGLIMAFAAPPITFVTFFAGTVWLYIVPECFKAPILNFFLDVSLRILRFLPEPANFALAAIYHGLMAFLERLRAAPDEQKVQAMDLFASLFAGNAEMAAGVLVGLAAGLWESTGGTVIFLIQVVAWLVALPFKLVQWVRGLISGESGEPGSGVAGDVEQAEVEPSPAEGEIEDDDPAPLGRSADPPGLVAPEAREPGRPAREPDETFAGEPETALRVRQPPPPLAPEAATSRSREDAEATRAAPDDALERASEQMDGLGPATEEEERREEESDAEYEETEAEGEHEEAPEDFADADDELTPDAAPPARGEPPPPAGRTAAPSDTAGRPLRGAGGARAPPSAATPLREGQVLEEEPVAAGQIEDSETDTTPPAAPDLPSLSDFLHQLATNGISREDVRSLIDGLRGAVAALVRPLAGRAADAMLRFLTAPGSAFRIGVITGTIAGMLIAEIALAVLTGAASTAVTAAKGIIMATRGVARLASIVARLRRALMPLFRLVQRLRRTAQGLLGQVMRWLDDVVQWMSRMVRRFLGRRPRGAPRPAVRPRPRAAPRSRPGARPRPATRPRARPRQRPRAPRRRPARRPRSRPRPRRRAPRSRRRGPRRRRRRRRQRDRGGIRARVRLAARAAWRAIRARALTRVIPRAQVLNVARSAARTAAAGIAIRVAIRHRGTRMWSLRISGRRGRRRASATQGHAWFGRDRNRRPHYSAARDQRARHRRAVRNLDAEMDRRGHRLAQDNTHPREIHRRLEPEIRSLEARPRPRPISGVRLEVQERRYDLTRNEQDLRYRYELRPNCTEGDIDVPIVPNYPLGRTRDTNHWLLRNAQPRIRNLGPYTLSAHRIYRNQTFIYDPDPAVWAQGTYQDRRWRACIDSIQFPPERHTWNRNQRRFTQMQNPGLATRRSRSMRREVVNLSRATTDARVVQGLMSHDNARSRRAMRSVNTEERFGGHTVERHVLGHGRGMQDVGDLARRAGWAEIIVHRRITIAPGGRHPSAFANLRNANLALRGARQWISTFWRDFRTWFATVPTPNQMVWDVTTPPVQAVRASRVDPGGAMVNYPRPGGGVYQSLPRGERPRYTRWRVPGGRAPAEGNRPLFQEHVAGAIPSGWGGWAAGRPPVGPSAAQPGNPITRLTFFNAHQARVVLRPSHASAAAGFYLLTMYPL